MCRGQVAVEAAAVGQAGQRVLLGLHGQGGAAFCQCRVGLRQLDGPRGSTFAQLARLWLLRRSEATTVLIGASKVGQTEGIHTGLAQAPFAAQELQANDACMPGRTDITAATAAATLAWPTRSASGSS